MALGVLGYISLGAECTGLILNSPNQFLIPKYIVNMAPKAEATGTAVVWCLGMQPEKAWLGTY